MYIWYVSTSLFTRAAEQEQNRLWISNEKVPIRLSILRNYTDQFLRIATLRHSWLTYHIIFIRTGGITHTGKFQPFPGGVCVNSWFLTCWTGGTGNKSTQDDGSKYRHGSWGIGQASASHYPRPLKAHWHWYLGLSRYRFFSGTQFGTTKDFWYLTLVDCLGSITRRSVRIFRVKICFTSVISRRNIWDLCLAGLARVSYWPVWSPEFLFSNAFIYRKTRT